MDNLKKRADEIEQYVPQVEEVLSQFQAGADMNNKLKHTNNIRQLAVLLAYGMHRSEEQSKVAEFSKGLAGSDELVSQLIEMSKDQVPSVGEIKGSFMRYKKAAQFNILAPNNVSNTILG